MKGKKENCVMWRKITWDNEKDFSKIMVV